MAHRIARLLDLEGRTVQIVAVEEPPPDVVYMATAPKIAAMLDPSEPVALTIKKIVFRLERVDGGGTLIYRRETGPWG